MFARLKFSLMLVLILFSITGLASLTHAQSDDAVASPPLTFIWQTAFDKDSVLIESNYLTVDSAGNSYIGQFSSGVMRKFDADGKFVLAIQADTQDLTGVGIDSQGNILLGGCERGHIQKFDSGGTALANLISGVEWCAQAIAVDAQDQVYVMTSFRSTRQAYIQKLDSSGQALLIIGAEGDSNEIFGQVNHGAALALDQDGNMYATDSPNNRILKFASDGIFLTSFALPDDGKPVENALAFWDDPYGVAVDGEGNIYVSNSHFLRKLDAEGNILAQWPTTEGDLYRAGRVAVDAEGNIYIVAEGEVTGANNKPFKALVLKKFQQS